MPANLYLLKVPQNPLFLLEMYLHFKAYLDKANNSHNPGGCFVISKLYLHTGAAIRKNVGFVSRPNGDLGSQVKRAQVSPKII